MLAILLIYVFSNIEAIPKLFISDLRKSEKVQEAYLESILW